MNTTPTSNIRQVSNKKLFGFLALFMLGGMILSGIYIYLWQSELFIGWEFAARIPKNTTKIIEFDPWSVSIQTLDNHVLTCYPASSEECWIPDVNFETPVYQDCDKRRTAFYPILNPPKNLVSCQQHDGSFFEGGGYEVIYAIDQDQNLWKWEQEHSISDILLMPFLVAAGGLGGVLLGSIVWASKRIVQNKRISFSYPAFSKKQIVILLVPWLILFSIGLFWIFVTYHPVKPGNSTTPDLLYTAVAETVTAKITEEARAWQAQATPGIGAIRYSFSEHACDAKWTSRYDSIPCVAGGGSSNTTVRKSSATSIGGKQLQGEAIWVPMGSNSEVYSEYPVIEIQDGDHFKSTIGCRIESSTCGIVVEIMFERQEERGVLLGRWTPNNNTNAEEINIDLSKFAGQKGRFFFTIESLYTNRLNDQDVVWFMPRIEK